MGCRIESDHQPLVVKLQSQIKESEADTLRTYISWNKEGIKKYKEQGHIISFHENEMNQAENELLTGIRKGLLKFTTNGRKKWKNK